MVVDAAVKTMPVPTSAIAHGTPVMGKIVGDVPTVNLIVVATLATVNVITPVVSAAVPEISNCQIRMLWPAEDATRLAELAVPATATTWVGKYALAIHVPDCPCNRYSGRGVHHKVVTRVGVVVSV